MSGEQPLANFDLSYDGKLLLCWNIPYTYGFNTLQQVWCAVHASPERCIGNGWDGWTVNQILPMDCQYQDPPGTYNKAFIAGIVNPNFGGYCQVVWTANGPAVLMQVTVMAYDPPQTQSVPYAGLQVVSDLSEELIGVPVLICAGGDVTSPSAYPAWALKNVRLGPGQNWGPNIAPNGTGDAGVVGFANGLKYFSLEGALFLNPDYAFRDPTTTLVGYAAGGGAGGGQSSGGTLNDVSFAEQNQGDSVFLMIITDGSDAPVITSTIGASGPTDPYPFQFIESAPYAGGMIYLYASVNRTTADPSWDALNVGVIVADSTTTKWDTTNVESSSGPIGAPPTFVVASGTGTTITVGPVTVTNPLPNSRNAATQVVLLLATTANIVSGPSNTGSAGGEFVEIYQMHQEPPFAGNLRLAVDAFMLTATESGTYTATVELDASADWSAALTTIPLGKQLVRPEMFQTIDTRISANAGIAVWNGSQFGQMYSYFDGIDERLYWYTTNDPYDWPSGAYPLFTSLPTFVGSGYITAAQSGGNVTGLTFVPPLTGGPKSAMLQLVFYGPDLTWTTPATGFLTTDATGAIVSVMLTAGGSGYSGTPFVGSNQAVGAYTGFDPAVIDSVVGLCHVHDGILVGLLGDAVIPSLFHACRSYDGGRTWTADANTIPKLPTSALITATISGGGIATLTLLDPSFDYPASATLGISFVGGGGSGATATAGTDQYGRIDPLALTITNPGFLYTSVPGVYVGSGLSQVPVLIASRNNVYLCWIDSDYNPQFIASTDCGITWQ